MEVKLGKWRQNDATFCSLRAYVSKVGHAVRLSTSYSRNASACCGGFGDDLIGGGCSGDDSIGCVILDLHKVPCASCAEFGSEILTEIAVPGSRKSARGRGRFVTS